MRMVFRWYGEGNDTVTLKQIKQIPGVEGIVWALHDVPAGEEWPMERILAFKKLSDESGLHLEVVESVNVHDDIKIGLPTRDLYIENYKKTIAKLATVGVKTICYSFMPVFESTMPGWEPERLGRLTELFEAYKGVTEEKLRDNLRYFLEQVVPVAEQHGIKMAIQPDDPPYSSFGLPRIVKNRDDIRLILDFVDSPSNGVTLCSGSLGANPANDIAAMVREFADRIPFAHLRNVRVYDNGDFIETSHPAEDGTVGMTGIVQAYSDIGFTGYARVDHGGDIWDEQSRPGYGLYDRALGIMNLWGLWDSLERTKMRDQRV